MKYFLFFGLLLIISCQKKFDSDEWKSYSGEEILNKHNPRNRMVADLVKNGNLKGKKSVEIRNLLGKPNTKDSSNNIFYYDILESYGMNVEPNHIKTLEIHFNKDSTTAKVYLDEWKKN